MENNNTQFEQSHHRQRRNAMTDDTILLQFIQSIAKDTKDTKDTKDKKTPLS